MMITSRAKNNLVILSAFGWGILFFYMLIFEEFTLKYETDAEATLMLFAAPFVIWWLGYHHLTKPRGTESLSLLTCGFATAGITAGWIGIAMLTDETTSSTVNAFLLIVFGVINLVLASWCFENSSGEKVKPSDLKFEEVLILYKEISAGKLSNLENEKYGSLVSDAALQAFKENQLNVIANGINLSVKLEEKLGDHKIILGLIMDKLSEAYVELNVESKYELFPLFINKSDGDTSYYFHDTNIQKWALNSYEVLLKKDNLSFEKMEKEYFDDTPLAEDYPYIFGRLKEYIGQQQK